MRKIAAAVILSVLWGQSAAFAYTDQITVKAPEAWEAAKEVLKPRGVKKIDEENYIIETKWVTDRVVRSRGMLKQFASQTYERRYRFRVKVTQRDYDTEIEVKGTFQERPHETNSSILMWQSYRPEGIDYDVERQVFMQILNRLELARSSSR